MKTVTKVLLVSTVLNLAVGVLYQHGVLPVGRWPGLYVTLPVGAACFGMFLLSWMLEKESASYDAEHQEVAEHKGQLRLGAVRKREVRAELRALLQAHHH